MQVARCTKIIPICETAAAAARAVNPAGAVQGQRGADEQVKYVINIKQNSKFVVGLGDRVAPTDIEEGMRVGYIFNFHVIYIINFILELIAINIKYNYLFLRGLTASSL